MLVRWRPKVFVSSSISGLENLRGRILDELEALELADPWLFEYHGVASGAGAARQYLQVARDCDVFVLVVGNQVRQGTRDEYDAALADNPEKILPFFLGDADPDSETLRANIRDRHRYWPVGAADELPAAIAAAVREYLQTGAIVRPGLTREISSRRLQRQQFLGVPEGFGFEISLRDAEGSQLAVEALTAPAARFVLTGPPGAGKSDVAAEAVTRAAKADGRLPLLVAASGRGPLEDWLAEAFEAARFFPGPDLVGQYLRDGRVALAIDGLDELEPDHRTSALREIARVSRRYPRISVLVLSRLPRPGVPSEFGVATVDALTNSQIDSIFLAARQPRMRAGQISSRLVDLMRLPFWAALAAVHGASSTSALDLLEALVGRRLADGGTNDAQGILRLRSALGALAMAIRPLDRVGLEPSAPLRPSCSAPGTSCREAA